MGTVAISRPPTVLLKAVHSALVGQHESDGKQRQLDAVTQLVLSAAAYIRAGTMDKKVKSRAMLRTVSEFDVVI
jgi:hypothetical protein